jgi:low affinity Fe/Cu permease
MHNGLNGSGHAPHGFNETFRKIATCASSLVGSKWAFVLAAIVVVAWAATGPIFHFSDTWQLVINTGTTIVTFLMVFLIQNTQNRDARAIHLKLDELIRGVKGARNNLLNLEELTDEEMEELRQQFEHLRERAAHKAAHHHADHAQAAADKADDAARRAEERAARAHDAVRRVEERALKTGG